MNTTANQTQESGLFDNVERGENSISVRKIDASTAEGELKLRLSDLNDRIEKLEKAEMIPHDLLEATISI